MKKFSYLFFLLLGSPLFADNAEVSRKGSLMQTFIMIGIAILFFYFILWRPERKRRKDMEAKRGKMQKGDQVTAMGIIGTLDKIKEQTVILKMVDGSKIEFLKAAISEVKPQSEVQVPEVTTNNT